MLEKYHWTFEYVVWGISYMNLQMLLADSREYFTDFSGQEGKKDEEVIKADDPSNKERMYEILGWKNKH